MGALASGLPIPRPVYDSSRHLRSSEVVTVAPADVVLVEGILVLAEKSLRERLDLKIYVDTDPDLRLARRLERDIRERGRSVTSVLNQYFRGRSDRSPGQPDFLTRSLFRAERRLYPLDPFDSVRPMQLEFVEPSKCYADLIIPEGYTPRAVATVVEMLRARLSAVQA